MRQAQRQRTVGAVLAVYASAGILFETFHADNAEAELALCRLFLCNNAPIVWRARQQLTGPTAEDLEAAIGSFRTALQRDPHDPNRWADLGEAFFEAGRKEEARYCYGQVEALAPRVPPFLLRAANFHFLTGENQKALPVTARTLRLVPDYDAVIFSQYTRLADSADVLQFDLPEDPRAARSWLRFVMEAERLEDAQRSWDWVAGRGLADDAVAGEYAWFLIRQGHPEAARAAWSQHAGGSSYLYNGDFEREPAASPFDWSFARAAGVEVARDDGVLRIRFAGTENLAVAAASQHVFVRPGHYRFRASIRTDGVTTDQGIRFRIFDAEAPARLDVTFGQFTGSSPWSDVQHDLIVPRQTRLLQVQVIRHASEKFDNRIGGTAWIDGVRLEPVRGLSPQRQTGAHPHLSPPNPPSKK